MPSVQELSGSWMSAQATWLAGVQAVAGISQSRLRPVAEGRGATAQVVRFNDGPAPAMVWQDRNGDGRADIIEIFRGGGVIVQIIDADYDGQANVLRRYDASGRLLGEERL